MQLWWLLLPDAHLSCVHISSLSICWGASTAAAPQCPATHCSWTFGFKQFLSVVQKAAWNIRGQVLCGVCPGAEWLVVRRVWASAQLLCKVVLSHHPSCSVYDFHLVLSVFLIVASWGCSVFHPVKISFLFPIRYQEYSSHPPTPPRCNHQKHLQTSGMGVGALEMLP